MDFSPLSDGDIENMLKTIGIDKIDDLFVDIPESIRNPVINLSNGLSELDTLRQLKKLAKKNKIYESLFRGAGAYNHFIPPVVNEIIHRNEFYTSYTPYQAEMSQGFLQAIFEYQTVICNLTAMDAANASVYDGATAAAESMIMAKHITGKSKILVIQPIHPDYHKVLDTYAFSSNMEIEYISLDQLEKSLELGYVGAVIIQNPNFFGELEDIQSIVSNIKLKSPKTLVIYLTVESTSMGLLKRPGNLGVDIFCGEGQPIGLPISFGGPGLGIIATTKKYMRKLPGRIVGKTKELFGENSGYVLTLQAREQHIRREKAISNICTNQALCMLAVLIYLVSMGYKGLKTVADVNVKNSFFLQKSIHKLDSFKVINYDKPHYNEFLVECPKDMYDSIFQKCSLQNMLPPLLLSDDTKSLTSQGSHISFDSNMDYLLVCTTEMNTNESHFDLIDILKSVSAEWRDK